jgi:hypothetical protein
VDRFRVRRAIALSACGSSTAPRLASAGQRAATSGPTRLRASGTTLDYLHQQGSQSTRVAIYLEEGKVGLYIGGVPALIAAGSTSYLCGSPGESGGARPAKCATIKKEEAKGSKAAQAVEVLADQYLDPLGHYGVAKDLFAFESSRSE